MVPTGNKASMPFVGQPYHKNNSSIQNGQTHSSNSSAVAEELFECV